VKVKSQKLILIHGLGSQWFVQISSQAKDFFLKVSQQVGFRRTFNSRLRDVIQKQEKVRNHVKVPIKLIDGCKMFKLIVGTYKKV